MASSSQKSLTWAVMMATKKRPGRPPKKKPPATPKPDRSTPASVSLSDDPALATALGGNAPKVDPSLKLETHSDAEAAAAAAAALGTDSQPKRPGAPPKGKASSADADLESVPDLFDRASLTQLLQALNSRFVASGSIWAATDMEIAILVEAAIPLLRKYASALGPYAAESALLSAAAVYAVPRLMQLYLTKREPATVADVQPVPAPAPAPAPGAAGDPRLEKIKAGLAANG